MFAMQTVRTSVFVQRCVRKLRHDSIAKSVFRFNNTSSNLQRTCLYDFHVAQNGKMVPFAGWEMPVQYKDTISESHLHVRENVGIFDVSHMLQTKVVGKDRIEYMESLVPADVQGMKDNTGTLSVFLNEKGGILDDLIVTKTTEDYLYVVSNAGCIEKDFSNMQNRAEACRKKGLDVKVEKIQNALVAVQGPKMTKVLQPGINLDLGQLPFMTSALTSIFGIPDCRITRCGYTGEDGVEISVTDDRVEELLKLLLSSSQAEVRMAGLGARDSLRLEAGLCLYGNDITEDTTPVEANLNWVIAKRRRETGGFPGADVILNQLKLKSKGISCKRVGFLSSGPPARAGAVILDAEGQKVIGQLTSGCPSPSLKKNVSMGYVETAFSKTGTAIKFKVRQKLVDGEVVKMPFVPTKYFTGK
ncbi:aminomethyltransferase, mitochondrial-like [Haliotis rufescens]|uniref:aminomethyltransferase, mitochondrial-like n=1 Tax=Haliotis rufescens TaxID=6454 RepID=UPI001EB084A6|nr:aminomethyltransferase, mitochondrial-like [Haliotis rufescens]